MNVKDLKQLISNLPDETDLAIAKEDGELDFVVLFDFNEEEKILVISGK